MVVLVAAFFLLQFPQVPSGRTALAIFAFLYVVSWMSWPRLGILHGPWVIFVALTVLSLTWSEHPGSAIDEVVGTTLVIAAGLAVGAAVGLNTILVVSNRVTVVIGAVSLLLGVFAPSFAIHSGPAYSGTLQGLYISKNSLAVVILFGATAALFRKWPPHRGRLRLLGSFALYSLVLYQAQSATVLALLALAVAFRLVYGWWIKASDESRAAAAAVILAPTLLLIVFGYAIYTGVLDLLDRDITLTGRTDIWAAALDAWATKPLLGVGWGSFESDSVVSYFQLARYGWVRNHAHSGYVQMLTELGVVGFLVLVTILITTLVSIFRMITSSRELSNGWLMMTFVSVITHNAVEQSMKLLPLFMLTLVWAACRRQRALQSNSPTRVSIGLLR